MSIENINNGESGFSVRGKLNQVIESVNTGGLDGTSGTSGTSGAAGADGTSGTSGAAGSTFTHVTDVTLLSTGWTASNGDFVFRYSNETILSTSRVDVIPDNSTLTIVENARIYPKIVSGTGFIDIFAKNQPTDDILVDIIIWN
jgi:hypothetical protein